jgi:hypothetical protein
MLLPVVEEVGFTVLAETGNSDIFRSCFALYAVFQVYTAMLAGVVN